MMHIKKTICLLLLSVTITNFLKAQQYNDLYRNPDITPPTPVSQEFQKYLGYPIDYSTGTANISIPLYNLQVAGKNIPFELKYHSSGIKIDQSYGPVGFGWSLFPAFRITRTIMDKPDETSNTNNITYQNQDWDYLVNIAEGDINAPIEGQFDIFNVMLPDMQGSFVLKKQPTGNGFTAQNVSSMPLKINVQSDIGALNGFTVTDDQGVEYIFGGNSSCLESTNGITTGWVLSSMVFPGNKDTVTFTYQNLAPAVLTYFEYTTTVFDAYYETGTDCDFEDFWSVLGVPQGAVQETTSQPNVRNFIGRSLTQINFPNGKIIFNYSGSYLSSMTVQDLHQNNLKQISFGYADFLLKTLSVSGIGNYSFEYNPQEFSYVNGNPGVDAQDRWGFYNGKSNPNLVPKMQLTGFFNRNPLDSNWPLTTENFGQADRSVDTTAMKANSLEKINYPTGGWTRFYYSPHAFLLNGTITYGGGLRIRQEDSYDPVTGQTLTKYYSYGTNGNGLGNLLSYPYDDSFLDEKYLFGYSACSPWEREQSARVRTIYSHSRYRFYNINFPVWYDKVTEYETNNGKTEYTYAFQGDNIGLTMMNPYPTEQGRFFTVQSECLYTLNTLVSPSPELIEKKVYKTDNNNHAYTLVQDNINQYTNYGGQNITGEVVWPWAFAASFTGQSNPNTVWNSANQQAVYNKHTIYSSAPFFYYPYAISTGKRNLSSSTIVTYSGNNAITENINYLYDGNYPYNLISRTDSTSDGGVRSEMYYYPTSGVIPDKSYLTSSQQAAISDLLSQNRLTTVIQQSRFKNNTHTQSALTGYGDFGNNILKPQQLYIKNRAGNYESRVNFNTYDAYGNISEQQKVNDAKQVYLWGYNGEYPVAKVIGSDYNTVKGFINQAILDNPASDAALTTELNKIRTGLKNTGAQVFTYTYAPMIGMTSETDPKGNTIFYEYDSSGRLINAKDNDNNVIKRYDYHYQGQ